jgi:hypothetical protein
MKMVDETCFMRFLYREYLLEIAISFSWREYKVPLRYKWKNTKGREKNQREIAKHNCKRLLSKAFGNKQTLSFSKVNIAPPAFNFQ